MEEPNDASVLLLAALLLVTLCVEAVSAGTVEPPRPLRVVTYNLLHAGAASSFKDDESHLKVRLEIAIRELQALDPDVIALQEASQSRRYGDVPEPIARRLDFNLVFAPATDRLFGFRFLDKLIVGLLGFKEGSAILSRLPILASETYDLPRCHRFLDPRILLRADLSTPWGPLQIFSPHTRRDECQASASVGSCTSAGA